MNVAIVLRAMQEELHEDILKRVVNINVKRLPQYVQVNMRLTFAPTIYGDAVIRMDYSARGSFSIAVDDMNPVTVDYPHDVSSYPHACRLALGMASSMLSALCARKDVEALREVEMR